jgi:hypothetical protein
MYQPQAVIRLLLEYALEVSAKQDFLLMGRLKRLFWKFLATYGRLRRTAWI